MADKLETYYDILRVPQNATIAEIVAAYHSAKSAFSKDSIATYSLMSPDDTQAVLTKLEEAYMTLSNIDKKRQYDKSLQRDAKQRNQMSNSNAKSSDAQRALNDLMNANDNNLMNEESPMRFSTSQNPTTPVQPETPTVADNTDLTDPHIQRPDQVSGPFLRTLRERRSLSLEDVSRITKIPHKFIKALEDEDEKTMPARVYVQGFIKNLATLYKLEPQNTAKMFLVNLDNKKQNN